MDSCESRGSDPWIHFIIISFSPPPLAFANARLLSDFYSVWIIAVFLFSQFLSLSQLSKMINQLQKQRTAIQPSRTDASFVPFVTPMKRKWVPMQFMPVTITGPSFLVANYTQFAPSPFESNKFKTVINLIFFNLKNEINEVTCIPNWCYLK